MYFEIKNILLSKMMNLIAANSKIIFEYTLVKIPKIMSKN